MTISFIICTYNRDSYIYECLSRLAQNTCQVPWELVLVDNNSTDHTSEECARFALQYPTTDYHYHKETQQGLSYARNRGIKESKGDWLVFLDDDAMVENDYIETLYKYIQTEKMDAFGGKIVPRFEEDTPKWLSPWSMSWVSALDLGDKVRPFEGNQYPIGANMGISRQAMERVGDFNTALGRTGNNLMGGEEKDIFNRIREAGYRIVYLPNIAVHHMIPPRRTTSEFIARLGEGVGKSERQRTKDISQKKYLQRLMAEGIKWGGTIVLWCKYLILCQPQKGNILVLFRRNVTRGLLNSAE